MPQNNLQQLRTANGLEIMLAFWLMISPFGLNFHLMNAPLLNSVGIGLVIAAVAVLRIVLPPRYGGLSWLQLALGFWLMASPFVLGFEEHEGALWNSLGVGMLCVLLALWSHAAARREAETRLD